MSVRNSKSLRVGGRNLGPVRHICAFFHSKEEEYATLRDFIKDGMEAGEKGVHIIDTNHCATHRQRLQGDGIDVEAVERNGQLEVACWEEVYLKDGYFDQDRQLALLENILIESKAEGYPLTRVVANMEWALEEKAGVKDIVEYECKLNNILPRYADPVICTYDLSRFSASIVMDTFVSLGGRARSSWTGNEVVLTIADKGCGFNGEIVKEKATTGLSSMAERVLVVNGVCEIASTPRKGTTISVRILMEF